MTQRIKYPLRAVDPATLEEYNWWSLSILQKLTPYTHEDTIELLAQGRFIINYKPSTLEHAEQYKDLLPLARSTVQAYDRAKASHTTKNLIHVYF